MKELLFEITDCNPAALGCGNEATKAEPDRFAGFYGSRCFVRSAPAGRLQSRSIIYKTHGKFKVTLIFSTDL